MKPELIEELERLTEGMGARTLAQDELYEPILDLAEQALEGLTKEEAKHLMDLMTDRRIAEPQCSICLSAKAKLERIAGEER